MREIWFLTLFSPINETWIHRIFRLSVDRSEGAKATDYRGADATTPQQAKRCFEQSDTNITDRAFIEPEHLSPVYPVYPAHPCSIFQATNRGKYLIRAIRGFSQHPGTSLPQYLIIRILLRVTDPVPA